LSERNKVLRFEVLGDQGITAFFLAGSKRERDFSEYGGALAFIASSYPWSPLRRKFSMPANVNLSKEMKQCGNQR